MPRTTRHLLIFSMFLVLSIVDIAAQVRADQISRGEQWLSWSAKEKIAYVSGFLDGYLIGTYHLCDGADKLFQVRDPHSVPAKTVPGAEASAVCFATRNDYSKEYSTGVVDFSPYVDIVTEFYTKHPDYDAVPFPELMLSLGDGKCNSADQLYQKALKGELHRAR
jgi:hypothetical protein